MSFWLEFEQNGAKQEYPFDTGSVAVGRDKSADFVLDHPTVSRQHALIVQQPSGYRLVVLSRSGMTAIDGNQVQGEVDIFDGCVLHFGQLHFTFRSNMAPRAAAGGFGGQAAGFGGGQQAGGFGAGGQAGGFGGGQQAGGFGAGGQAGGFGAGGQAGGFGAGGQAGGFGGGQQAGGFGAGGQAGGFGAGQQAGGFGAGGQAGGFGAGGQAAPAPAAKQGEGDFMSWDDIAASAEANPDAGGANQAETDFQRIQAAAQRADEQSKSNPILMVGAGLLIVGLMAFILMPQDQGGGGGGDGTEKTWADLPPITWQPNELDCVGSAECMAKARQSYKVGLETLDKVEVDIANRFEGYRRLVMAEDYAKKAGQETIPAEFGELDARREKARGELDAIFQQSRVKYHNLSKRKMYTDMVDVLNEVMAVFPYKGAREHQWALSRERHLKEEGNYPQTFR